MKNIKMPDLSSFEQSVLDGVTLRLISLDERERFNTIIDEEHYLHSSQLVGEQCRYVASITVVGLH